MLLPKSFGLVAQFCTKALKPFLLKIIVLLRYLFDNLFKLITRLITIFLIVIFIVHIRGRLDDKIVSLEPITVPIEYIEKYGISEQSLTNLLIDQLRFIDTNVSTRRSGISFKTVSKDKDNEMTFKYHDINIPLNSLYFFLLRDVLKIEPDDIINGRVIEVGGKIWMMIRIVGKPYENFCWSKEKFKDIERNCTEITTEMATEMVTEMATEIAEYCYKQIDPYRMALYYFQKHRDIVKNSKKTMFVEDIEKLLAFYEDLEKSKNLTDVIIEKSPEDFWALNLKGLIFLELVDLLKRADLADQTNLDKVIKKYRQDALQSFNGSINRAKEAKEPFPPAHTGCGHAYDEQKKFIRSFSKYNEAIEEGENDAKAYLGKANSFLLFFLENSKEIQDEKILQHKKILQDRVLIRKIKFFPDDYKSVEEVFNGPKKTRKKYAIGFYNNAIKQFEDVGRARSNVTESLKELRKIVEILEKDEMIDKKIELKKLIKCLDTYNPI